MIFVDLENITKYLANIESNYTNLGDNYIKLTELLKDLKSKAVENNEENLAKEIWKFEKILNIQNDYLIAFSKFKNELFYEGWCALEKVEISIHFLEKHFKIDDKYKTSFIKEHTLNFQSLFPYKIFISPEILITKQKCSICNNPFSLLDNCGHVIGEIYKGEMCSRVIEESRLINTAFVENPVQKYSVPFLIDPKKPERKDNYNYHLVKFCIQRLFNPFDAWNYTVTKERHPHTRYKEVGRNDKCPCESGKKYKKCCLRESGILRPHYDFHFSKTPPKYLQTLEFSD